MRTFFPWAVAALTLFALPGIIVFAADILGYEADVNAWLENSLGLSHRVAVALPGALVLFCVPPLLILLYFLRLKRKPVPVSSTFLWKKSIEDLHVNRLMQWLRRNILLLLQLLAAFGLIYAIMGPRLFGPNQGGRRYIILIDHSASMSATDVKPNRLAWAKAAAMKEIDNASDSDVGMVIAFNSNAEIRQSYTTNKAALKKAVDGIEESQTITRIDEALNLAASLANPSRSTENNAAAPIGAELGKERTYVATEGLTADVLLYSDGKFPPVPEFALANLNLSYHIPPTTMSDGVADNVGIVRFTAEREDEPPGTLVARARVWNFKPTDTVTKVRCTVKFGTTTNSYELTRKITPTPKPKAEENTGAEMQAEPGAEYTFTLPNIPENVDVVVQASIVDAKDIFPLDDDAWVVVGVVRKARLLVVSTDEFLFRKFFEGPSMKKLAEMSYLSPVSLADPTKYAGPVKEGKYDLVIFDQCAPPSADDMPAANTYFVGYAPPPYQMAGQGPSVVAPVKGPQVQGWQGKHPLMRFLGALHEIEIIDAFKLPELPPRTPRLLESDRDTVLLAAIARGPYTDLVQTFPLVTSDGKWNTTWPLKSSFPLFLRNVLFVLGNVRDANAEESIRPGDVKLLRPPGAKQLRIEGPKVDRILERGTRADFAINETAQAGVYTASWADQSRKFAVNLLSAEESDLAPVGTVKIGSGEIVADTPRRQPKDLWKWAVVFGLLVVLLEWWVYNKRVQI